MYTVSLNLALANFRDAHEKGRYRMSVLEKNKKVWLDVVLPFMEIVLVNDAQYQVYIKEMRRFMLNGWVLGIVNPENKPLNKRTYPDDWLGPQAQVETAIQLAKHLWEGEVIAMKKGEEVAAAIPTFNAIKRIDPLTGEIKAWRMIRDGACGTEWNPSINMVTPKINYETRMPMFKSIARWFYIGFKQWGYGFYVGKGDEKGAFRQLFMKKSEWKNMCYKFDEKWMQDTRDIWGSKGGSKRCQELGQLISMYLMILVNGVHNVEHVLEAKRENLEYFRGEMWMRLKRQCTEENRRIWMEQALVFMWDKAMVKQWLRRVHLGHIAFICEEYIKDGIELLLLNRDGFDVWGDDERLMGVKTHLFNSIRRLKLSCSHGIKLLINNYVDDFYLIMPPDLEEALKIMRKFAQTLEYLGIIEEPKKREGPVVKIVIAGLEWDTRNMTVVQNDEKKFKLREIIYKCLFHDGLMCPEYESMMGKLENAAIGRWPAKAFLRRLWSNLYEQMDVNNREESWIGLPRWARKDLHWWLDYNVMNAPISIIGIMEAKWPKKELFLDGATNGSRETGWTPAIGGFYEGHWFYTALPMHYRGEYIDEERNYRKKYNIAHFETLAVVTGLNTFDRFLDAGTEFVIRTDNNETFWVLRRKTTKDLFQEDCLRWFVMYCAEKRLKTFGHRIHTKVNGLADALSRFAIATFKSKALRFCRGLGIELDEEPMEVVYPRLDAR
eukprot:482705_1